MIAVLTPTTSPIDETSGPPELPGFSAASVWMTSSIVRPVLARIERPSADTTPAVTVDSKPSGLPIATTSCPRRSCLESPRTAVGRSRAALALMSAISVSGILADQLRVGCPPFGIGEPDVAEAVDHVAVGDDQPVRGNDEARAEAALSGAALPRVDPHDGGPDFVGDTRNRPRIGVEERRVAVRRDILADDRVTIPIVENELKRGIQHGACLVG